MASLSFAGISFPLIPFLLLSAVALIAVLNRTLPGQTAGLTDTVINRLLIALIIARIVFVVSHLSDFSNVWQWFDIRDRGFDAPVFIAVFFIGLVQFAFKKPAARKRLVWIVPVAMVWIGGGYALYQVLNPPPERWPEDPFVSLDGESVGFSAKKEHLREHRLTVVNLWASWCPSCRTEMPALEQAQGLYPDVRFILLNQGESATVVNRYLTQGKYRFDNVWLDRQGVMGNWLGQTALPVTLVFNPEGELVNGHMGVLSKAVLAELIQKTGQ